jgi:hypothetical protein
VKKWIYVVMWIPDESGPMVAFESRSEARKYIRKEMQESPVPRHEWDDFFTVAKVELA